MARKLKLVSSINTTLLAVYSIFLSLSDDLLEKASRFFLLTWIPWAVEKVRDNWVLILLILVAVAVITGTAKVILEGRSNRQLAKSIIDKVRDKIFRKHESKDLLRNSAEHNNRVTIFKFQRRWVRQKDGHVGILKPILRAGSHTNLSKKEFKVFVNKNGEGVVGLCYSGRKVLSKNIAPFISEEETIKYSDGTFQGRELEELEAKIVEYAKEMNIDVSIVKEQLKSRENLIHSIVAIPLLGESFKKWGVIVIDSECQGAVPPKVSETYSVLIELLGTILEDR